MDEKTKIYKKIKAILSKHREGMDIRANTDQKYEMYGKAAVKYMNKEFEGMYFASTAIRKNSVVLYFFPIYTHPREFTLSNELKKCLKGKSCFHIKKDDPALFDRINELVEKGYCLYSKQGLL